MSRPTARLASGHWPLKPDPVDGDSNSVGGATTQCRPVRLAGHRVCAAPRESFEETIDNG